MIRVLEHRLPHLFVSTDPNWTQPSFLGLTLTFLFDERGDFHTRYGFKMAHSEMSPIYYSSKKSIALFRPFGPGSRGASLEVDISTTGGIFEALGAFTSSRGG